MVIYRPGVGRVYVKRRSRNPLEVPSFDALPHPGYHPDGSPRECDVAERVQLPGGLIVEHYGAEKRAESPPPAPLATREPLPEILPKPSPTERNWRDGFGLMRGD